MSQSPTLSSIFEATKSELADSLSGLLLPKDADKVQMVIIDYLNKVCDEQSAYRQNLTQSEDYILQAALSMLNAQRQLVSAFEYKPEVSVATMSAPKDCAQPQSNPISSPYAPIINGASNLIGAGGGAVVGKLLLGGWGAVFGAIAGTAVALYLSQNNKPTISKEPVRPTFERKPVINDVPIDTSALLTVIAQICDSLDNLIETFRAQIKRVVNKYESQEKPTIERNFRVLLEGIQSLIGYKRGHSPEEEKYLSKLQDRIEDLADLLDNYSLEAVDYQPEHFDWFEAVESKNTTEIKMVTPAIVKSGALIIKGKIFIPSAK